MLFAMYVCMHMYLHKYLCGAFLSSLKCWSIHDISVRTFCNKGFSTIKVGVCYDLDVQQYNMSGSHVSLLYISMELVRN